MALGISQAFRSPNSATSTLTLALPAISHLVITSSPLSTSLDRKTLTLGKVVEPIAFRQGQPLQSTKRQPTLFEMKRKVSHPMVGRATTPRTVEKAMTP